jgi:hypothetical protein
MRVKKYKIINLWIFAFIVFNYSCKFKANSESLSAIVTDSTAYNSESFHTDDIIITIDTTFEFSRKETPYKGKLKRKYQWSDKSGKNRLIISYLADYRDGFGRAEIYGYHYIFSNNMWRNYWQMNDFVDGLGCDLMIDIKKLILSDVDSNSILEPLIIYTLDNRCDAVGVETKLLYFVKGVKIAVRGISCQYLMPPEDVYQKVFETEKPIKYKTMDSKDFDGNKLFIDYASITWDNFIDNENRENRHN